MVMARNPPGYAQRIRPYTSSGGSMPPRARWTRSLLAARTASNAIGAKTITKMITEAITEVTSVAGAAREPSLHCQIAIPCSRDHGAEDRGRNARADPSGVDSHRRGDQCTQEAVESLLAGELAAPRRGEAAMDAAPPVFERLERRARGERAAADREAQAVA